VLGSFSKSLFSCTVLSSWRLTLILGASDGFVWSFLVLPWLKSCRRVHEVLAPLVREIEDLRSGVIALSNLILQAAWGNLGFGFGKSLKNMGHF
jgi:hypothetical protein